MPGRLTATVTAAVLCSLIAVAHADARDHGRNDRGSRSDQGQRERQQGRRGGDEHHQSNWSRRPHDERNSNARRVSGDGGRHESDRRHDWNDGRRDQWARDQWSQGRRDDGRRHDSNNSRSNGSNSWRDHSGYVRHDYDRYRYVPRHDVRRYYPDHGRYRVAAYYRPYGYRPYRWYSGARLPVAYYAPRYVVYDYYSYGLRRPPYGYQWVRVDDDVILAAVTTGIVLQVVNGIFW